PSLLPTSHLFHHKARSILEATNVRDGYCIAWGVGSGGLVQELVRQSKLHVLVVEPDAAKVEAFRREMVATGLYGARVAVLPCEPGTVALPPYLASLMVSEEGGYLRSDFLRNAFASLRPYGGVFCLDGAKRERVAEIVKASGLPNARLHE